MHVRFDRRKTSISALCKRLSTLRTASARSAIIAPGVKGMGEGEFYELVEHIFDLPEVKAILPKAGD